MKATQPADPAQKQKLMGEVRLARLQLAKAESQWVEAKEQARLARRRRKEAKQAARRAKKQARQAKEKVAETKLALAELEARLARPDPSRSRHKRRRKPAKNKAAVLRRKREAKVPAVRPRASLKINKPALNQTRFQSKAGPAGGEVKLSGAIQDVEPPVAVVSSPARKSKARIVRGVKKIFPGEVKSVTPVETGTSGSLSPENKALATSDEPPTNLTINQQETL